MGKVTYIDKHIVCPYFKRFEMEKQQIVCEGVDGASSTRVSFPGVQQLKDFAYDRCAKNYCLCVVCRGLHEFYEGD